MVKIIYFYTLSAFESAKYVVEPVVMDQYISSICPEKKEISIIISKFYNSEIFFVNLCRIQKYLQFFFPYIFP